MDPDSPGGPGALGVVRDLVTDVITMPRRLALARAAVESPARRVLAVSVARPERAGSAAAAAHELERSRCHRLDVRLAAPQPGIGRWESVASLLAANPLAEYDWLLIFDDDVILPRGFLDTFVFLCERFELTLAQPAHKHWSHAAPPAARRRAMSVVRSAPLAELGPLTAVHSQAFAALTDGGFDALQGSAAGIVDATPVRRTGPLRR
jgi:hypothetical protein